MSSKGQTLQRLLVSPTCTMALSSKVAAFVNHPAGPKVHI